VLITTVGNLAANRRWTFGVTGSAGAGRAQLQGLLVLLLGLALTSGALALLHEVAPAAPRTAEVATLVVATAVATVLRFLLFRYWIFRAPRSAAPDPHPRHPLGNGVRASNGRTA
jgi:putative flippase GtrA